MVRRMCAAPSAPLDTSMAQPTKWCDRAADHCMSREAFCDGMFELVDLWTQTIVADEYARLLVVTPPIAPVDDVYLVFVCNGAYLASLQIHKLPQAATFSNIGSLSRCDGPGGSESLTCACTFDHPSTFSTVVFLTFPVSCERTEQIGLARVMTVVTALVVVVIPRLVVMVQQTASEEIPVGQDWSVPRVPDTPALLPLTRRYPICCRMAARVAKTKPKLSAW